LSDAEFWQLSRAQLFALMDARKAVVRQADRRAGVLTQVVRGAVGARNPSLWDFFPEHKDAGRSAKAQTARLKGGMRALAAMGKVKRKK